MVISQQPENGNLIMNKLYRVDLGKYIDLYFTNLCDALAFIEGFNYARRQREEIIYEFKDDFKTRGYAFAFKMIFWFDKMNIKNEWYQTRPCLTEPRSNGNQ